jgi:diaminohydroxyphosphoribosylaminopyrimidine deaminase/5-amino-6-(5-phosphoribosylamino)uracil reductase
MLPVTEDEKYMSRCLALASLGSGNVAPNPLVGAVLVHGEKIIGEGYHQRYGEAHAEVNCINSVSSKNKLLLSRSTLYVSLEPCVHFGKTPPCTDLIIQHKIPKVVIGCLDVFEQVNGKGQQKLQNAGVQVITGVLAKECSAINSRFFAFHLKKRPYIILKWAESMNGKIAAKDHSRMLISNEFTNRLVHKWRNEEAAIMVGTNTAMHDDPSLSNRYWSGKDPVRIIIDKDLRLPPSLKIFNKEIRTIIFNEQRNAEEGCLSYIKTEDVMSLQNIMRELFLLNIQSVLVEGGATLLQSFIDDKLWDEARVIKNESLTIENGINAPGLSNYIMEHKQEDTGDVITYFKYSGPQSTVHSPR